MLPGSTRLGWCPSPPLDGSRSAAHLALELQRQRLEALGAHGAGHSRNQGVHSVELGGVVLRRQRLACRRVGTALASAQPATLAPPRRRKPPPPRAFALQVVQRALLDGLRNGGLRPHPQPAGRGQQQGLLRLAPLLGRLGQAAARRRLGRRRRLLALLVSPAAAGGARQQGIVSAGVHKQHVTGAHRYCSAFCFAAPPERAVPLPPLAARAQWGAASRTARRGSSAAPRADRSRGPRSLQSSRVAISLPGLLGHGLGVFKCSCVPALA